jgi:hypothetical protein
MKVLVSAATKYRAASEIGQAVADVLAERGCEVRGNAGELEVTACCQASRDRRGVAGMATEVR